MKKTIGVIAILFIGVIGILLVVRAFKPQTKPTEIFEGGFFFPPSMHEPGEIRFVPVPPEFTITLKAPVEGPKGWWKLTGEARMTLPPGSRGPTFEQVHILKTERDETGYWGHMKPVKREGAVYLYQFEIPEPQEPGRFLIVVEMEDVDTERPIEGKPLPKPDTVKMRSKALPFQVSAKR